LFGASPARQVVFEGRASRPLVGGFPPLVVALAAVESADTFAGVAPSTAATVYEYSVAAVSPVSVKLVA
jgi:hypothetical protein